MMSNEERFQMTVDKLRKELAEGQIEVLQDSLSNFEWPDEYKEILQNRIEDILSTNKGERLDVSDFGSDLQNYLDKNQSKEDE